MDTGVKGHKWIRVSNIQNSRDPRTLDVFCELDGTAGTGWVKGLKRINSKWRKSIMSLVSCKKIDKKCAGWKSLLWFSFSQSHLVPQVGTLIFAASSGPLTHK